MSASEHLSQQFKGHPAERFIGMIPTETAHQYREFDRPVRQDLVDSLRTHGFTEPLVMEYSKATGHARIGEGNHRIAAARALGMTHVPVRVWRLNGEIYPNDTGGRKTMTPKGAQQGYVPADMHPRDIGLIK